MQHPQEFRERHSQIGFDRFRTGLSGTDQRTNQGFIPFAIQRLPGLITQVSVVRATGRDRSLCEGFAETNARFRWDCCGNEISAFARDARLKESADVI